MLVYNETPRMGGKKEVTCTFYHSVRNEEEEVEKLVYKQKQQVIEKAHIGYELRE